MIVRKDKDFRDIFDAADRNTGKVHLDKRLFKGSFCVAVSLPIRRTFMLLAIGHVCFMKLILRN